MRGKIQLISFKDCTVTYQDTVLFDPSWGVYDMAVGKEIVSAYAGPASVLSFTDVNKVSETKTHKINYSDADKELYALYQKVRDFRKKNNVSEKNIEEIFNVLIRKFSSDWLLLLELYELSVKFNFSIQKSVLKKLEELKCNKSYTTLIEKGIVLCKN